MTRDEILDIVEKAMEAIAPDCKLDPNADITESGLDSMAIVDFFLEVESRTGVSLKEDILQDNDLMKVENLVTYLEKNATQ